jgi:2-hydroxychromene-2-carboxylate isomerase
MDFYFDFVSPYGYMAAMKIEALAAKYNRTITWHPLLLGIIFKTTGAVALVDMPIKGEYAKHDMLRTCRLHDIPFRFPSNFPVATQAAARATYYLRDHVGPHAVSQFVRAVYHAYFVDDIHIGEPANVLKIAGACGFDVAAIAQAIQSDEYKAILKQEVEQAMALGVFGSPYVIVRGGSGNEAFWGFDHFYQIEAFLKNGTI